MPGFSRKRHGAIHRRAGGQSHACLNKAVAFFYARSDVVLAVPRPETACMALPARSVGNMQWPFAAKTRHSGFSTVRGITTVPGE